jgi:hypothetical protein
LDKQKEPGPEYCCPICGNELDEPEKCIHCGWSEEKAIVCCSSCVVCIDTPEG